jgi:hypothetical protein
MDLSTTYTHHSELQVLTAPPLISTSHKSPQHLLSLSAAFCVFTGRSLVTASNSEGSSASRPQVLSSQSPVQNWLTTESESYVTADGQSVSLPWNKAPIWGLRPDFYYCQTAVGLLMWSALSLSLTRAWVCRSQLLLILASAVILGSESRGTRDHILLFWLITDFVPCL